MSTQGRAQFTPGPWEVTGPNTCEIITSNTGTYKPIMTVAKVNGYWDGEVLANMHLIAAAPAMYLALQNIVEGLTDEITRIIEGNEPDTAWLDYLANKAGQALSQAEGQHHE